MGVRNEIVGQWKWRGCWNVKIAIGGIRWMNAWGGYEEQARDVDWSEKNED